MTTHGIRWAAVLTVVILSPAARSQPDRKGDCKHHQQLLAPANLSSLSLYGTGDLSVNQHPSPGVKQSNGGEVGMAYAVLSRPEEEMREACRVPLRRPWTILVGTNFLYNESGLEASAIQQTIVSNPQNVSLLGVTSGKAKFYSWTAGPTFQWLTTNYTRTYFFVGAGWFRRTVEFTGAPSEGSLIQASNPGIFGHGGNSAGVDAGFGMDFGRPREADKKRVSDIRFYFELRWIRGLAVNQGTTLIPVSAGIRW